MPLSMHLATPTPHGEMSKHLPSAIAVLPCGTLPPVDMPPLQRPSAHEQPVAKLQVISVKKAEHSALHAASLRVAKPTWRFWKSNSK